ncbi:MAG TPA: hypothetical protein EYP68_06955 [Candidatus Korarchaeota archaeon]|nr:hypothetical protein [Candidatus Korarchaeota archaeon]
MKKAVIPLLVMIIFSSIVSSVNSQGKTRNPFAVGFQFDRPYYEPNSTGTVKIWVISWVESPLYIDAVFLHFDWMRADESISVVGLNVTAYQYEPIVVAIMNFTIPDVEAGWYGYVGLVYYSAKIGGRWIKGKVRAPDPVDQREFGHDMYLISVGHPIGEGPPMLYWNVYNYTQEVRRGDYLTVWVDLANVGGYYAPSIHALLIDDQGKVVGGITPANIYAGIEEPYPLLFLSEGIPAGVRARLFWKIPENYSLGYHNITLVIVSGQIPQDSRILNFTVLKSYREEAEEKLEAIDKFLERTENLLDLSKEIGLNTGDIDLISIKDEYELGMTALFTGDEKSALGHADDAMHLANSIVEKLKPLSASVEKEISKIDPSKSPIIKDHLERAIAALERARSTKNPVDWAENMTIALTELLQARNLSGTRKIQPIYAIAIIVLISSIPLVWILRKRRKK